MWAEPGLGLVSLVSPAGAETAEVAGRVSRSNWEVSRAPEASRRRWDLDAAAMELCMGHI
ncbi:hypothetical protein GCM10009801_74240 [Streptomyces albiaxialis]|uniref:Uncharacterized protein n=1 Tax=Streptomyces albiaxialis TaxID=329523 RepID=A0ABP5IL77_9ACTN